MRAYSPIPPAGEKDRREGKRRWRWQHLESSGKSTSSSRSRPFRSADSWLLLRLHSLHQFAPPISAPSASGVQPPPANPRLPSINACFRFYMDLVSPSSARFPASSPGPNWLTSTSSSPLLCSSSHFLPLLFLSFPSSVQKSEQYCLCLLGS